MAWQFTPYTGPVFISAVVGLGVATFAIHHRGRRGATSLAVFMIGASLWSFAEGMNLAHADLAGKLFWSRFGTALTGAVPLAWFTLVLEYTGNDRWLRPRYLALLVIEPVWLASVVVFRPQLVRPNFETLTVDSYVILNEGLGPALYAHIIYSYLLILVGGALLVKVIIFAEGLYRTQSTALLGSIFVPLMGNVAHNFELLPPVIDYTSIGFLFSGIIITTTILQRQLLEIVPIAQEIAREEVLEHMDDRVIVLDDHDRIADVNPAAATLLGCSEPEAIGRPIEELLPELAAVLEDVEGNRVQADLSLESGGASRYYDVRVTPLHRAGGIVTGTLVSLRDVTEQRQQRQRLDVLNRLLRHNLRNDMNVIAGNAELLERSLNDPELVDRVDRIESTATEITSRSDKVGRVARMLDDERRQTIDLADALVDEVADAHSRYPEAEITVDVPAGIRVEVGPSITVAINELLTNAIEHNDEDAPTVHISAEERDGLAVLEISDDGPGIDPHELEVLDEGKETALQHGSGVGLWVINWIVEQFGGRLDFETDDDGCTVTIRLPSPSAADDDAQATVG